MSNIKLSDISRVIFKEDGNLIVTITKCDNNWQQPFSIEGKIEDNSIMNFIYWLSKCLNENHNLELSNFKQWDRSGSFELKFLWGGIKTNYEEMSVYTTVYKKFRKIYENSGIPPKLLGLHSFRSGFYCQAYLNAINKGTLSIDAMKELTMLLAGWKHHKHQDTYEKEEFKHILTYFRSFKYTNSRTNGWLCW